MADLESATNIQRESLQTEQQLLDSNSQGLQQLKEALQNQSGLSSAPFACVYVACLWTWHYLLFICQRCMLSRLRRPS